MSALGQHAEEYLALRRAVGFKLISEGQLLGEFVRFAEQAGQQTITTQFALRWARSSTSTSSNYLSRRLRAVRSFARYLRALDPSCEVPPIELLPASKYRPAPYLYSDQQILALMTAARTLGPPLRAATMETLIGLLACTGLRIGEALRMDREDVDETHGLLTIRNSKFGKSREVLLDLSTVQALSVYGATRDRQFPDPKEPSFFLTTRGTRPAHPTICQAFHTLLDHASIQHPTPNARKASPGTRSASLLRGQNTAWLLPRRWRCRLQNAAAVHLSGPHRSSCDVLVPLSSTRAAGLGRRPA
jgi:integrase/recombinase XerD